MYGEIRNQPAHTKTIRPTTTVTPSEPFRLWLSQSSLPPSIAILRDPPLPPPSHHSLPPPSLPGSYTTGGCCCRCCRWFLLAAFKRGFPGTVRLCRARPATRHHRRWSTMSRGCSSPSCGSGPAQTRKWSGCTILCTAERQQRQKTTQKKRDCFGGAREQARRSDAHTVLIPGNMAKAKFPDDKVSAMRAWIGGPYTCVFMHSSEMHPLSYYTLASSKTSTTTTSNTTTSSHINNRQDMQYQRSREERPPRTTNHSSDDSNNKSALT